MTASSPLVSLAGCGALRLRLVPLVSALAICLALPACKDSGEREAHYLKRGAVLFDKGDYEKARIEFKNAAGIKPTDPEVRYRLGLVDEAQGDLANAFANFYHATEQNSRYAPALLKMARYYIGADHYDEASSRLAIVLEDDPDNADAHALQGALALRQGRYEDAQAEAERSLRKDPSNLYATSVLTGIHVARKDEAAATALLDAAIARNPRDLALLNLEVAMYRKLDDAPKAIEAYRRIIERFPGERKIRVQLAQFLSETGRVEEAETALRDAVTANPADWDAKHLLVAFLDEHRGLEAADKEVRLYMSDFPDKHDLYFWLADLYLAHGAADQAMALLQDVVEKDRYEVPGLNARTSLARINFARGNREMAAKLVTLVLEKDPGNHAALLLRAGMSYDAGRYQSAVSDLRSILRDDPHVAEALQLLAEALARQGRVDLAVDTLSQLVDLAPASPQARVRLAQMYHLNHDDGRAYDLLASVLQAAPLYAVAEESVARIAIDQKDWDKASAANERLGRLEGQAATAGFLRGEVLVGTGHLEEASRQFTAVIAVDPKAPIAEKALAAYVEAARKLGRLDAAARYVEQLKADSPYFATVQGEIYAELGDLDAAGRQFDRAIAAKSDRADPYLDQARLILRKKADPALAIDVLRKGHEAAPGDVQLPLILADTLGKAGRVRDAIDVYAELLDREPGLDLAANNMASLIADHEFADAAALDKARRVAERFLGSTNPIYLDTLGWVYYRQGASSQALATLERAVTSDGAPAALHYHYGAALLKADRREEAKAQLRLAVRDGRAYTGADDAKRLLQGL